MKRPIDATPSHPARSRLIEAVASALGINETGLRQATGLKRSVVRHHLKYLVDAGILRRVSVGRENHYFPANSSAKRMGQVSAASHGRAKDVLRHIYLDPGIPQAELGALCEMTRKVLRQYLNLLQSNALIIERREGRILRYWPATGVDNAVHEHVTRTPASWWTTPAARDGQPPSGQAIPL